MVPVNSPGSPAAALERLARTQGSAPLLTHYGPGGERTELSVRSFANWADKTAHLLDDLGLSEGDEVTVTVLAEHPAHWMALVWPFALWQRGLGVRVAARADAVGSDLVVTGPEDPAPLGGTTIACSLDPWARPLTGLPAGVLDFGAEALAQPDLHLALAADPAATAWNDGRREFTFADLADLEPLTGRVLAAPVEAWDAVALLAAAVLGGGSVVYAPHSPDQERLARSERARVRTPHPTAAVQEDRLR